MSASIDLVICMGSACHQMGAFDVVAALTKLLKEHNLQEAVNLKGAFCQGECGKGVVVDFDGRRILHVRPETVKTVFDEEILPCFAERKS